MNLQKEFHLRPNLKKLFCYIEPGKFKRAEHFVTISTPFWLSKFPVTQGEWTEVMGSNPSCFKSAGLSAPVERVSWFDCVAFTAAVGNGIRLPTEAEWEYACVAGSDRPYYIYSEPSDDEAWFLGNSDVTTHPVGLKLPNAWGIHDLLGNVWEWCSDWKSDYPTEDVIDPRGPVTGTFKVKRGGSWAADKHCCNPHIRNIAPPNERDYLTGLRVVFPA